MEIFLKIIALILLIAATFLFTLGLIMPAVGTKRGGDYAVQFFLLIVMIVTAIYLIA